MRRRGRWMQGNRVRVVSLLLAGSLALMPALRAAASEVSGNGSTDAKDLLSNSTEEDTTAKTAAEAAATAKARTANVSADNDESSESSRTAEQEITSVETANETMDAYRNEGMEWEEIYIDSVEDMKAFSRNCWLDTWSVNKKVYLQKDLDLTGSDFISIPTFGGYFDGQGHTVSGLQIKDSLSYTGLFCYTQRTAAIVDLKVQGNVCPSGKAVVVGGVVGDNSGILMNCSFEGNVEGSDYVGGITGFNEQSGILIDCSARGNITGAHYTGGIVGENAGNITGCVNEADVNTSNKDRAQSLDDFNLEQYAVGLFDIQDDDNKSKKASPLNNTIDSGGIAGLSIGIIQLCSNSGTVGYEHVGYNMGGIVGRQSGYVASCENTGTVYGRKDVGGIAGQTEPYIAVNLSEDIAYQLSENIDELHDLTGRMLKDAGTESDTVSARLTVIQDFMDRVLEDTGFLADRTIEWTDGMIGSANDAMSRLDYVMDESGKDGGFLDAAGTAAANMRNAAGELGDAVEALDVYQYMTSEERAEYDAAKAFLENAPEQYAKDYAKVVEAHRNYYIDKIRSEDSAYTRLGGTTGADAGFGTGTGTEPTPDGNTGTGAGPSSDGNAGTDAGSSSDGNTGTEAEPAPDGNTGTDAEPTPDGNTGTGTGSSPDGSEGTDTEPSPDSSTESDAEPLPDGSAKQETSPSAAVNSEADMERMLAASVSGRWSDEQGRNEIAASEVTSGDESGTASRFRRYVALDADAGQPSEPASDTPSTASVNENNLRPKINGQVDGGWTWNPSNTYEQYFDVEGWVHYDSASGVLADFPQSEGEWAELDQQLLAAVTEQMELHALEIERNARNYADEQYRQAHPGTAGYEQDMKDNLTRMTNIILKVSDRMSEEARNSLQSALDYAKAASENMESAGYQARSILGTLNGMQDLQLPQLGGDYRSRAGSLNANLQGLSENMGHLNDEMASTNDVMLADLAEINDQFSKIMRLYTDAIDGVLDMDYTAVYEDNSQEDAATSTEATIAGCSNSGMVQGDLNVAGIAGTMAIEYDFDLEGDVTGIDNARLNSTFLTKCVLRQNSNEGNITAQKSYVGGIAGLQEMGTILHCENYGRITSTAGNYVGGIAGQSLSYITNGYAKCTVSGEQYVAGIAGSGSSMENCCAMVRVQDASAFYGAIAGETDNSGTVAGNCFVSEEIAGIDRISYSGKAEPVSYEELLEKEGLPGRFRMMRVTFFADDEEVKRVECPYGGNVLPEVYPDIPVKDGFYADWDIREIKNIMYDEDVTAEYVRYLTTLASGQTRENGQSALLADGMFRQEDVLQVVGGSISGNEEAEGQADQIETSDRTEGDISLKNVIEHWQISLPEDGNTQHQLRYQAPQGQTEGVKIYVKQDGEWNLTDSELMGIYHLFMTNGTEAEIAVCVQESNKAVYLTGIAVAVLLMIVMAVIYRKRSVQKKKRSSQASENVA